MISWNGWNEFSRAHGLPAKGPQQFTLTRPQERTRLLLAASLFLLLPGCVSSNWTVTELLLAALLLNPN